MRARVSPHPEREVTPARSLALGAAGLLLLSVPFFVFGLAFFDTHARVSLECPPGGPCTLARQGWLTQQVQGTFPLSELRPAAVERSRSRRGAQANIFRPRLYTSQGSFPLTPEWFATEAEALQVADAVNRFRENPSGSGLSLAFDNRRRASRLGLGFLAVGTLLLPFSAWLALRAWRRRGLPESVKE
jgi:hypothetical protein